MLNGPNWPIIWNMDFAVSLMEQTLILKMMLQNIVLCETIFNQTGGGKYCNFIWVDVRKCLVYI